jgi:hypothetical protein
LTAERQLSDGIHWTTLEKMYRAFIQKDHERRLVHSLSVNSYSTGFTHDHHEQSNVRCSNQLAQTHPQGDPVCLHQIPSRLEKKAQTLWTSTSIHTSVTTGASHRHKRRIRPIVTSDLTTHDVVDLRALVCLDFQVSQTSGR